MLGAMQDWDLLVTHVIDHAARETPNREIVTHWADGSETRTDWAGIRRDALKMAQALEALDIQKGDRVASLAMNHSRHLVSWYGVAGMGGVLHTINPRLFEDQLEYIANHAEDRVLLYDAAFQPIIDKMKDRWTSIEHYICYDPPADSEAIGFEDWIGAQDGDYTWAQADERDPCMLCYTSGTTGNPKGVLYEHRSTVLHAMAAIQPPAFNFDASSVMLPVVPMFHAASWGLPFAGGMAGIKFVFSAINEPAVLYELMEREGVTDSAGVPTVWLATFQYCDGNDKPRGFLNHTIVEDSLWTWGNLGYVPSGSGTGIGDGDALIDVVYALNAPYRAKSTFVMNSKTAGALRKLKDADGRHLWADGFAFGEPGRLLGYPVLIAEDMPDIEADSYPIAFGDFTSGYTIAERPDLRVLRDPFSAKPHVLFYASKRVGGDVSDFAAIKLLRIAVS